MGAIVIAMAWMPASALAHQPRIVASGVTDVHDPELSQAFYGALVGAPAIYRIVADDAFDLYVNVLVPERTNANGIFSVDVIRRIGERQIQEMSLDGTAAEWVPFYEPFGGDHYRKGPEFRMRAKPGMYEIVVWNAAMEGAYTLAIGEREQWGGRSIGQLLVVLPVLKAQFFGWSIPEIVFSRIGIAWAALLFVLSGVGAIIVRRVRRAAREVARHRDAQHSDPAAGERSDDHPVNEVPSVSRDNERDAI